MKLSEMMQWLLQLLPQQKAKGDGNVQVGRFDGDLNNSQHTTTHNTYNTIYVVASESSAHESVNESKVMPVEPEALPVIERKTATAGQLEVLRLMRMSQEARDCAEEFMQKHFKTKRVKSLDDLQCKRTRRWVETCVENDAPQRISSRKTG